MNTVYFILGFSRTDLWSQGKEDPASKIILLCPVGLSSAQQSGGGDSLRWPCVEVRGEEILDGGGMRGEEFLLQGEQTCGHLSSLSGRAIALGSEPPLVARKRELAWVQSCSSVKKKTKGAPGRF